MYRSTTTAERHYFGTGPVAFALPHGARPPAPQVGGHPGDVGMGTGSRGAGRKHKDATWKLLGKPYLPTCRAAASTQAPTFL